MQGAPRNREQDDPSAEAEQLFLDARTCFSLACTAKSKGDIEHYAAIGRGYLGRAHEAARVEEQLAPGIRDLP